MSGSVTESRLRIKNLRTAAHDMAPVSGLTHKFYRYPARFSPVFAASAIREFSRPGDLVLDPYMGGGTTIVESLALGRTAVGNDLNSLSVFIARVKTTPLAARDRLALLEWAEDVVPTFSYLTPSEEIATITCDKRTVNLNLPIARPIKKIMALALLSLAELPSESARDFARCVLLNVGQWALNGRKRSTPLTEFREALSEAVVSMLEELAAFETTLASTATNPRRYLINDSAAHLHVHEPFSSQLASLVVTSPPYPGVHMLYHRWQVDGRRESPAPYWIAACHDGQGAAYYNFADRRENAIDQYFVQSLRTLQGIRRVVKRGAHMIQMVAFSNPADHLPKYLSNMREAGFEPLRGVRSKIERTVPSRRWHASQKGRLNGSNEVVLIHRAI